MSSPPESFFVDFTCLFLLEYTITQSTYYISKAKYSQHKLLTGKVLIQNSMLNCFE